MTISSNRAAPREEDVVEQIRRAILDGSLVPGQRLVEAELCEGMGVKRGTVRAALIDLEHQGLVERRANRGARVRIVTVDEAVAITEVRMAVEGLCAAKAAQNVTDEEVVELQEVGQSMRQAVATGDVLRYSELNSRLHELVGHIANQSVASDVLANLRARNVRHQYRLSLRSGRPQVSLPQHLAIIDAICRRDAPAAEAAARAHLSSVIEALKESPDESVQRILEM